MCFLRKCSVFSFHCPRERKKTSNNYFQRRARRLQRTATRTNLIGSFTFSRDISIRICIPRGKSVGFSLSSFRREAWEMCRFFPVAPNHPSTPLSLRSLALSLSLPGRSLFSSKWTWSPASVYGPRILGGTYISSIV